MRVTIEYVNRRDDEKHVFSSFAESEARIVKIRRNRTNFSVKVMFLVDTYEHLNKLLADMNGRTDNAVVIVKIRQGNTVIESIKNILKGQHA